MLAPDEVRTIIDRHHWQPGERDQAMAELAERRAERESSGEHEQPHSDVVIKARPIETAQPQAARTRSMTDEWTRYIKAQLDKRERAMSGAIADLLADERKAMKDAIAAERGERQKWKPSFV